MKTLELKDLKYYLGTGLQLYYKTITLKPVIYDLTCDNIVVSLHRNPLMLPLSALTEQLPDGSIPIVELHKIAHGNNCGQTIKYWFVDYSEKKLIGSKGFATLEYYDLSKSISSFSYDEELCRFITRDETRGVPKATAHQLQLFEYLYQNHFWLGDQSLFETGEIIDKRSLR